MLSRRALIAALGLATLVGCGDSGPAAPTSSNDADRVLAHLTITGRPESATGATWTYRDTVDGIVYDLSGVLLKPEGGGPFPAVIVSHGAGGSASNYSRYVGTTMVRWGAVVIATNYTMQRMAPQARPAGRPSLVQAPRMSSGHVGLSRFSGHLATST